MHSSVLRKCAKELAAGELSRAWLSRFTSLSNGVPGQKSRCLRRSDSTIYSIWRPGFAGRKLYIGNDSGMTHLAAATETPVVALFGPTDPASGRRGDRTSRQLRLNRSAPIRDLQCEPDSSGNSASTGLGLGLPANDRLARGRHFVHPPVACGVRRLQDQVGILSTSLAIEIIALTNRSSSRLLSVSVGSIISAPRTISGKLTV